MYYNIKEYGAPPISAAEKEKVESVLRELSEKVSKNESESGCNIKVAIVYNKRSKKKEEENQIYDIVEIGNHNYKDDVDRYVFNAGFNLVAGKLKKIYGNFVNFILFVVLYNRTFEEFEKMTVETSSKDYSDITFYPQKPRFTMDQVVIAEELKREIRTTLNVLRLRKRVYEDWGFKKIDPEPKAILNFYGPPGTGKTMTAHAIANELGLNILALNYADIESKYVGDAPKNLVKAFEVAKKENCLLFFDEADSFLGKRILNVQSSSDQAVNSLRSQMFILLDQFDGIVIFATNLLSNYDKAFESRIFRHIKFELPKDKERYEIIKKTIPSEANALVSEDTLQKLVKLSKGFSGREIKNAVLEALILAAEQNKNNPENENFLKAFEDAKKQREKVISERSSFIKNKGDLEEKIKIQLKTDRKQRSLLDIATAAAYADDVVLLKEKEVIITVAKGFGIDYVLPEAKEELPDISKAVKELETDDDKIKALDVVSTVISSDGYVSKEEEEFILKLSSLLGIKDKDSVNKIINYCKEIASSISKWEKIKKYISFKS